ncbi:MAG: zinc ribbon domain-containing protein [Acidobacteria bacterium]|nr:zinc ribbon domain-containing protein [Acidobacteriota bacterium]
MPLYEYECDACGQHFELIRRFADPDVDICAVCGKGPVRRLLSSPAIQFKGSGWYITDYARKAKAKQSGGEKGADGKSEAGSGEKKSDAAPTSTSSASMRGSDPGDGSTQGS